MADLEIHPISINDDSQVKDWILRKHYIKRWPTGVRYKLGVYLDTKLSGVLLYGPPLRAQSGSDLFKKDGTPIMQNNQVLELLRAFTTDEAKKAVPNLGSMVISRGNNWIYEKGESKDHHPIKAILSYADPEAGHGGVVYKATNAAYLGKQKASHVLVVKDPKTGEGIEIHPMSLKRFGTSNIDKLKQQPLFKGKELEWEPRDGKHKYLYPLGKDQKEKDSLMATLQVPLYSYPEEGKTPHEIPNTAKEKPTPVQQAPQKSQSKSELLKQLLRSKVYNPETKRKILVKTALGYDDSHPSKKQARGMVNAYAKKYGVTLKGK